MAACIVVYYCRLGILTGVCVTAVLCIVALLLTDWEKEATLAKQRVAQEAEESQALEDDLEDAAVNRDDNLGKPCTEALSCGIP